MPPADANWSYPRGLRDPRERVPHELLGPAGAWRASAFRGHIDGGEEENMRKYAKPVVKTVTSTTVLGTRP